jgi:hypothetical protein
MYAELLRLRRKHIAARNAAFGLALAAVPPKELIGSSLRLSTSPLFVPKLATLAETPAWERAWIERTSMNVVRLVMMPSSFEGDRDAEVNPDRRP